MSIANIRTTTRRILSYVAGHKTVSEFVFDGVSEAKQANEDFSATTPNVERTTHKAPWREDFVKRVVLQSLEALQEGKLTLYDGNACHVFGNTQEEDCCARIDVQDPRAYQSFFSRGSIGAGEAFMHGYWSSPDLVKVVRVFCKNIDILNAIQDSRPWFYRLAIRCLHRFNANSLSGSKNNISAHYDLGNDFFNLFLDKRMMYSSAIFSDVNKGLESETLEHAAENKLEIICQKLKLQSTDHLLEIGTGWGGMAIYAAAHYGCRVTTTTISQEQYEYALEAVQRANLSHKVTVLLRDYRELTGQYDKLVSIEMIEAVGHEYYDEYFSVCTQLLKPEGLMCIQAITIADQRFERAKRNVDFIQQYIFPGGCLPSLNAVTQSISQHTDLQLVHLQDIGRDYAHTLKAWRTRYLSHMSQVKDLGYSETFCRMWEYYLCYCEGGFLERTISTVQLVMARPQARYEFSQM